MGPKPPDIAAAAMTPEVQPAMPGAPRQELAIRVAEQVKQRNWREANKIARGTLPEQRKSNEKAEQIGTERDKDGKKTRTAGSEEDKRFKRIETADASVRKFLTEGYDKLPAADKTKIQNAVLAAARKSPLVAAELSKIPLASQKADLAAFAERIIKEDPKFAAEAARNFDEWIDSPELADMVTPLEIKATELEYQWELKQYDYEGVKARLTDVDAKLVDYDRQPSGIKGAKAQELDALKKELPTLTETTAGWKGNVTDIEKRLDLLRRGTATTTTASGLPGGGVARSINVVDVDAVKTAEDELKHARDELAKIEAKTNRIKELEQEETTLKQNKRELERENIEKEMEALKAQMELTKASGELADAKALRDSQETDVVKGIEDVFLRAAEGTFDNQTDAFLEAADEQVAAFAEQAKEANQKAVDKILQERYWKTVKRRKGLFGPLEDKPVIKRAEVNSDYKTLMQQGPEAVMRQILIRSKNPASPTGANYTTAEVDELLKNPDYVENVQPVMLRYLMVQRMATSGITQEDARIITMSSWGEGLITSAIEKSREVRMVVEGLIGEGALQRHGFMDRLRSELSKNPALWLLILAGGLVALPAGLIGGLGAAASYGAVGGITGGAGAGISYINRARTISPEEEAALAA